ncbi:hypothetical protein Droror1_Dr00012804 [Drosera rotundifolia]
MPGVLLPGEGDRCPAPCSGRRGMHSGGVGLRGKRGGDSAKPWAADETTGGGKVVGGGGKIGPAQFVWLSSCGPIRVEKRNSVGQTFDRSYHNGEHYNSVRMKEDPVDGPTRPIFIKADANLIAASNQAKAGAPQSKGNPMVQTGSIEMVIASSGCQDVDKIEQVLLQVGGDVDVAIEFMIAEQILLENDDVHFQKESW